MTIEEFREELELMREKVVNFKRYEIKVGRGVQRHGITEKVEPVPSMLSYHKNRLRRLNNER